MRTAVVFTSKFGATRRAAEYIAKELNADLLDLKQGSPQLTDHDAVVFGSGIYMGGMPRSIRMFISSNAESLTDKKIAVFVCCTHSGEKADKQLVTATEYIKGVKASAYLCSKNKGSSGFDNAAADAFIEAVRSL